MTVVRPNPYTVARVALYWTLRPSKWLLLLGSLGFGAATSVLYLIHSAWTVVGAAGTGAFLVLLVARVVAWALWTRKKRHADVGTVTLGGEQTSEPGGGSTSTPGDEPTGEPGGESPSAPGGESTNAPGGDSP